MYAEAESGRETQGGLSDGHGELVNVLPHQDEHRAGVLPVRQEIAHHCHILRHLYQESRLLTNET